MDNFKNAFLASALLFTLSPSGASASLIVNGSFEDGILIQNDVLPLTGGGMLLNSGATDIVGWTVVNDLYWIGDPNPWSLTASDGNRFLDLTEVQRTTALGGVKQTISTSIGQQYNLSFDLGSSTQYLVPSVITATAGSTSANFSSTNVSQIDIWETFNLVFTATSTTTEIKLDGFFAQNAYIGLDNVGVIEVSVPEPSVIALFLAGFIGLGFSHRRKLR